MPSSSNAFYRLKNPNKNPKNLEEGYHEGSSDGGEREERGALVAELRVQGRVAVIEGGIQQVEGGGSGAVDEEENEAGDDGV